MVASARRSPRAYAEVTKAGAHDGQIPPWVMRPHGSGASTRAQVVEPRGPKAQQPQDGGETPPLEHRVEVLPEDQPQPQAPSTQPPSTTPNHMLAPGSTLEHLEAPVSINALGAMYDNIRLESDRLDALGIIRDQHGRHLKATINPNGSPGYVEVACAQML